MISIENILEKLKCTLTDIKKTKRTYVSQINEQETYKRQLLTSIKYLITYSEKL